jgi:prevent-host-death family protein
VSIGVADLKARLSAYLDQVRSGQELLITDHGRPVARLVPVRDDDDLRDARVQRLLRAGVLAAPSAKVPDALLDAPPARKRVAGVLDALLQEREDGR